ncbi:MAG: hypothetical protein GY928_13250, partial [Colwellia sp.]|nr:hypothetical protein [Colwellia sp.]
VQMIANKHGASRNQLALSKEIKAKYNTNDKFHPKVFCAKQAHIIKPHNTKSLSQRKRKSSLSKASPRANWVGGDWVLNNYRRNVKNRKPGLRAKKRSNHVVATTPPNTWASTHEQTAKAKAFARFKARKNQLQMR